MRFCTLKDTNAPAEQDQKHCDGPEFYALQQRKESLFRQAVDAEKNKADLLEKKFQEAVKKAKETPDEPHRIRDFDLD